MRHGLRYGSQRQLENDMHEWIIAPLLEPDPTGMVAHRAAGTEDDDEADPDFARGEDRRDDAPDALR
jgi:hypothetical protein